MLVWRTSFVAFRKQLSLLFLSLLELFFFLIKLTQKKKKTKNCILVKCCSVPSCDVVKRSGRKRQLIRCLGQSFLIKRPDARKRIFARESMFVVGYFPKIGVMQLLGHPIWYGWAFFQCSVQTFQEKQVFQTNLERADSYLHRLQIPAGPQPYGHPHLFHIIWLLVVRCPLRRNTKQCYKAAQLCVCLYVCICLHTGCHT